ncbi:fumarylacetoacetate hydrolase [Prauserella coralliicola]|nr:fumarylacetoacetate hydrolase [Prauserella coralliicola]
MRLANVAGRAVLLTTDELGLDVEQASGGEFGPGLPEVYTDWTAFRAWAESVSDRAGDTVVTRERLGPPSPCPRQIVAIGLNYRDHAAESGFAAPDGLPPVFTKFVSSLTGPDTEVVLPPGGNTDWEVELVVVMGSQATQIESVEAWDHVAGLCVGQDLSERVSQFAGPAPQFSLGKSFAGFTPCGPWLVTPDSVPDKDNLELGCALDGDVVQQGRTSDLILPVSELIAAMSRTITLYPGDLVFTGTPAGVGLGRTPQRFVKAGETLRSWIDGIGELNQTFTSP